MRKLLFFSALLFSIPVIAQPGYINLVAGNGSSGYTGDGGPATAATMGQAMGVCVDGYGNVYIPDDDNNVIRKVDAVTGIITTIAGGGSSTADGVPATTAQLNLSGPITGAITTDLHGNIYYLDGALVRRVDAATNIVTTICGQGTSGLGDGGPATAGTLNSPNGLCFDSWGNMYIGDEGNARVRKINTAGIISTYAGTTAGYSGDGGAATAAQLQSPDGLFMDPFGNLFVADRYNYVIRKIDPSGIITTVAGGGSSTLGGVPATSENFSEPSHVAIDNMDNLYIADFHHGRVCVVNPAGTLNIFAGSGGTYAGNIPATNMAFPGDVWRIAIDCNNNIYVADRSGNRIWKVSSTVNPTVSDDSFVVMVNNTCSGMDFEFISSSFTAGQHVTTYFGDGTSFDTAFAAYGGTEGFGAALHPYMSGTYTIKHVLYDGSTPVDSLTYSRNFTTCENFSVGFYYDANSDCIKDSGDVTLTQPITIEVDSAGIPIDTVSATSGLYYTAYGALGTVYGFRVIAAPPAYSVSCPSTGIIYDTISYTDFSPATKQVGLTCGSGSSFDLAVNAVVPVTGVHDEWGDIYIQNLYCAPVDATVTLHYSPKYPGTPDQIEPAATSVSGNTIVWTVGSLSSTVLETGNLHYSIWWNGVTPLTIGDTVQSYFTITPFVGDADTVNNSQCVIDTIRAGCDPNEMWVNPSCIPSGVAATTLQYTINFENTGNDTAHNITVMDTLSANVDPSSLRLLMSSNTMYVNKFRDAAGQTIYKFDFPGINLLDSSHHGRCDGALMFNINTIPGLADGSTTTNRAGIYFDVNPVVMTNNAATQVGGCTTTSVKAVAPAAPLNIYPNPATTALHINTTLDCYNTVTITDVTGQPVLTQSLTANNTVLDIHGFASGFYYVAVSGKSGVKVSPLVKL